jgi:peptidoglycan hydrolase CwlO-like protein
MILNKLSKIYRKLFTLIFVFVLIFSHLTFAVYATPQQDLEKVQKQLEEIRKKKTDINKQIEQSKNEQNQITRELSELKGKFDLLMNQINEIELIIEELQLQIQILNTQITDTEDQIVTSEKEIEQLEEETDERLRQMYIKQKTFSGLNLIFSSEVKSLVKINLYQTSIQQETNELLKKLANKKIELQQKKSKLQTDKLAVQRDEAQVVEQKIALEKGKADLDAQRDIYYRKKSELSRNIKNQEDILKLLTDEEKKALAEQTRIEQVIFDSIKQVPSGNYVTKGTIIGRQGLTGYTTGYHLHFAVQVNGSYINPCNRLVANSICGSASGDLSWPMSGSYGMSRGYGWSSWSNSFHYALDLAHSIYNAPIYAAHDGYLYRGFEPCNKSNPLCKAGGANYVVICQNASNCNSGIKSMYWHLE